MTEPPKLVPPSDVAKRASSTVARHFKDWVFGGAVSPLTVRLGSPSEAAVAAHRDAVEAWVHAWERSPLDVAWEERRWPSLGRQRLPVAVTIAGADAICDAAGQARRWRTACRRREQLCALDAAQNWPTALATTFRNWNTLSDSDFDRLLAVLTWLRRNPNSGLLIRQLPIPGVDTKWLGAHRTAVTALAVPLGVPEHLGLREREVLRAVAILDPALRRGLPRLFAAPDRELDALELAADRVLVVENLQTLEALPELPGTVAVFGAGDHSTAIAGFEWVRGTPRVTYWGDMDAAGFAILARFRAARVCDSLLMDAAAVQNWRHLAVPDPGADPADPALLTDAEAAALDLLLRDGLRIEQERIPMSAAVAGLRS